ncbi:MAG: primosomal protein N' [Actinomycetota bacterium]|nr:primosomal protein N' [Actinomycetota bacterium]
MSETGPAAEQLALLRETVRSTPAPATAAVAVDLPVARVAVDVAHAHLDRPFDYLVPDTLDATAVSGARVRVRFAGRLVDGFVLERVDSSEHGGRLGRVERAVSAEVVLRPEVARLCRLVAERYAGTFADVVRLAVPPRHGREEKAPVVPAAPGDLTEPDATLWSAYDHGRQTLSDLAHGRSPRSTLSVLSGHDWTHVMAAAVLATLRSGRGSLVCLPDVRDVARLDATLAAVLGDGHHVVLTAGAGPQTRYRAFLAVARGHVKVVIGTRAAAFAPVHDLGLLAMWDDGDDLLGEPRAPYPHAREVLLLRAHESGSGVLLAAHARSAEAQALVESGWCRDLAVAPARRRSHGPVVQVSGSDSTARRDPVGTAARIPTTAQQAMREALASGPVLVAVARRGYRPALSCQSCRSPARCVSCNGPLSQSGREQDPRCAWCARPASSWSCPECGGARLRAPVVGERRTAEELGRALPGVTIRSSGGSRVLDDVGERPQLVVATAGAEPVAAGGYAAAVILDADVALARPDLRTVEETFRRWSNVVALVRPAQQGGRVMVVGEAGSVAVQALVRADPAGLAGRELEARRATRLPPAVRLATVTGPTAEVAALIEAQWPRPSDLLGPVAVDDELVRLIVRVPRTHGAALAQALRALASARSARKLTPLRIRVDPYDIE